MKRLLIVMLLAMSIGAAEKGRLGMAVSLRDGWLSVCGVEEGGPAERAGLRARDVIVAIDGKAIAFRNDEEMLAFFASLKRGDEVRFTLTDGTTRRVVPVRAR